MTTSEITTLKRIGEAGLVGSHNMDVSVRDTNALKRKGFIIRKPDDANRVIITDAGKQLIATLK